MTPVRQVMLEAERERVIAVSCREEGGGLRRRVGERRRETERRREEERSD